MLVLLAAWLGLMALGGAAAIVADPQPETELAPGCPTAAWAPGSLPVFVSLDPSALSWARELDAGISTLDALGPALLRGDVPLAETGGSIVAVVQVATKPGTPGGNTVVSLVGCRIVAARVEVAAGVPRELRRRVIAHELGHVLGLGHERDRGSVMFPEVSITDLSQAEISAQAARHVRREVHR